MKRVLTFLRKLNIYSLIALFGLAFVLISGLYIINLDRQIQANVLEQADLFAAQFNALRVSQLEGQYSDLNSINYQLLKQELISARNAHPEYRFIYLFGMKADASVYILADSELPTSPDYSPPGQLYPEAASQMRQIFTTGKPVILRTLTDRWGTWVSAAAPILDQNKKVAAVVRIDTDINDWNWELAGKAALPLWLLFGIFTGLIILAAFQRQASNPSHMILKRLMLPIGVILGAFILFTVGLFWNQQQHQLEDEITPIVTDVGFDISRGIRQQSDSLLLMSQTISLNPIVQQSIVQKNTSRLNSEWKPVFSELVKNYDLVEFDFLDAGLNCLMSVDGLESCTTQESHFTTIKAQKTGEPVSGLEIDEMGSLMVRVVYPVKSEGKIVGYLETARDVKKLIQSTSLQTGVQMAIVLKKQFLDRQAWEASMLAAGEQPEWDQLTSGVVNFSTQGQLLSVFLPWAEEISKDPVYVKTGQEITPQAGSGDASADNRTWRVAALPLVDASGTEIGHVLVMLDFSPQKRVFVQRLTISAAVSAALLAVLLGLVYLLLYQADKFVYQQQISLGESDDRFHQMFNQDNSAMLLVETGTGKILDANKAASLFYGYPADKLKSMNMSSIDCTRQEQLVHEQDAFNRSEKNHLILQHRLASGNIRDVMVYDSVINYLRQQVTFLVIEDVTERTIAEKALQHENQSLSNLLSLSEQFIENAGLEVNFEKLTRSVLQLTNGWAVIFNMYDQIGRAHV